jgi:SAM-dependent methyltransferase
LPRIDSPKIAFAHIDLNCAPPEVAAMEYLWPRLVPGALVVLDDYAYRGYETQKAAMDGFAASKGVQVLSLPTGQGLILRPPDAESPAPMAVRRAPTPSFLPAVQHNTSATCPACGGNQFTQFPTISETLATEWELQPYELTYIERQQGYCCTHCGCNLREMALAAAICREFSFDGPLTAFAQAPGAARLQLLEVNECARLSAVLRLFPGHQLVSYPDHDMQASYLPSGKFDLVLHSDTLEHIPDPVKGLAECRRLLRPSGKCMFTVPAIVDRLSRSRAGLPASYHGPPGTQWPDYTVHTEFGSDVWRYVVAAGYKDYACYAHEAPAAFVHIGAA